MQKSLILLFLLFTGFLPGARAQKKPVVRLAAGELEGVTENSVSIFKGIPYARPPVGSLRWREPQPAEAWAGRRKAGHFGSRAMQRPIYKDMRFRSDSISEDCLYLNVWTPALKPTAEMPVLVYFHGGGLSAGDGSEWRYDGASMAKHGIVMVTVNYRLSVFGFLALEELSRESPHGASGNYGFLDQQAALVWVQQNIARFGGDPSKVTIAGQSAGSFSVSAHMSSPLSRGLFRSAIGESGSMLGSSPPLPLRKGEENGKTFSALAGAHSLQELRSLPAERLLALTGDPQSPSFPAVVDGYFLPAPPREIFAAGRQADVPLLAGWTSAEVNYHYAFGANKPTAETYRNKLREFYGNRADEALAQYPAGDSNELLQSATDLSSDRFIVYGTWKWLNLQVKTAHSPVYRYVFAKKLPPVASGLDGEPLLGAPHSADIEYALGNLPLNPVYRWTAADDSISNLMQSYLVNFIKTGNPNGPRLPVWSSLQSSPSNVMILSESPGMMEDKHANRYRFLDSF